MFEWSLSKESISRHWLQWAIERKAFFTMTISSAPPDDDSRQRIEHFRAAVRAQALGLQEGHRLPMAISIHDIADSDEDVQKKRAARHFIRNTIMAVTVAGAGLWAAGTFPDFVNSASHVFDRSISAQVESGPVEDLHNFKYKNLRNFEYMMKTDLSSITEDQVRQELNYITLIYNGKTQKTLDVPSRLLLTKWAADNAGLGDVGLGWKDVYGVIHAESSWVQQTSKSGVPNLGLAQFEGATAKSYGLKNPNDPLHAIAASARMIKDAAIWSGKRLEDFGMSASQKAHYLRDGVSVYYNTGWKTRNKWSPQSSQQLPVETKTHILNVQAGNIIATNLAQELKAGAVIDKPAASMESEATKQASLLMSHLKSSKQTNNLDASDEHFNRGVMAKNAVFKATEAARKRAPMPS
jgi:hypothetical protein